MISPAIAETAEFYRVDASLKLDAGKRALLGQYMTPAPITRFMASLFSDTSGRIRVLDPGAGAVSTASNFRVDRTLYSLVALKSSSCMAVFHRHRLIQEAASRPGILKLAWMG